jgi:hypothetical protein
MASVIVAGVLVYLHKATTGVVLRWMLIPVAVVMALGFASERLIGIGKSLSKPVEIVKLVEVPVQAAATPLPCVATPAVKVLNHAKKVARKAKRAKKPAAEPSFWSF